MGEDGIIVNNITSINNNGEHPNFILKARLPHYDKTTHPKFYKVSTNEELNTLISNVVDSNYFLMEFLYNPNETDFLNNKSEYVLKSLQPTMKPKVKIAKAILK